MDATTAQPAEPVASLQRSLEITRDARFHANFRLNARNKGSAYVVSLLSTGVIFLSLLPNVFTLTHEGAQLLLVCSVVLSIFIIFYSLLDASNNYYHKSELLHGCARKINALLHDAYAISPNSASVADDIASIRARYQKILEKCPVNHDEIDFLAVKVRKPHLFVSYYSNHGAIKLAERFADIGKYHLVKNGWLFPHFLALALIMGVVWLVITGKISSGISAVAAPAEGARSVGSR